MCSRALLVFSLLTVSCQSNADAEQVALAKAKTAAQALGAKLKGDLTAALAEGTPADALKMCAGNAQSMTATVAKETHTRVGRSSLRLRNPQNAGPDWVRAWLEQHGERPAGDVKGVSRIDETSRGKVARFLAPIAIEPPCLGCHGPANTLSEGVKAGLAEHYPNDAATGYAVGDLRGAIWAEVPL